MALKISTTIDNKIGAYVNRGISKEKLGDMSGMFRLETSIVSGDDKNWVEKVVEFNAFFTNSSLI